MARCCIQLAVRLKRLNVNLIFIHVMGSSRLFSLHRVYLLIFAKKAEKTSLELRLFFFLQNREKKPIKFIINDDEFFHWRRSTFYFCNSYAYHSGWLFSTRIAGEQNNIMSHLIKVQCPRTTLVTFEFSYVTWRL